MEELQVQMENIITEWQTNGYLKPGMCFLIGCSTSEVIGEKIGTTGSEEVAEIIFAALKKLQATTGIELAFQCCEHLNRAIVVERKVMEQQLAQEVSVVPVKRAGGSMAGHAYRHLSDPVVIEHIKADVGMDIGETMIGMHIKHVAVPLRLDNCQLGQARVNAAYSRPKLIGGSRAAYSL